MESIWVSCDTSMSWNERAQMFYCNYTFVLNFVIQFDKTETFDSMLAKRYTYINVKHTFELLLPR